MVEYLDFYGKVVGCGVLYVLWLDFGEICIVVVDLVMIGYGIGYVIVDWLL